VCMLLILQASCKSSMKHEACRRKENVSSCAIMCHPVPSCAALCRNDHRFEPLSIASWKAPVLACRGLCSPLAGMRNAAKSEGGRLRLCALARSDRPSHVPTHLSIIVRASISACSLTQSHCHISFSFHAFADRAMHNSKAEPCHNIKAESYHNA
jgi:hypothetical protein